MTSTCDARPDLLRRLDGKWTATGDVRGKPVRYHVSAGPALHGRFTEIAMEDVQVPPQYEARLFIGFDEESQAVIACKDRFEFDADAETWTLEITAQQANGSWAHFAKYLFRRAT